MCGAYECSARFQTLANSGNGRLDVLTVRGAEARGQFVQFYAQDDFLIENISQLAAKP